MLLVFLLLLLPNQLANSQKLNYIYEQFYTIPIVTHSTLDHSTHNRPNFLPLAGDNRKPEDVNEPKNTIGCPFYPFADGSAMTKDAKGRCLVGFLAIIGNRRGSDPEKHKSKFPDFCNNCNIVKNKVKTKERRLSRGDYLLRLERNGQI